MRKATGALTARRGTKIALRPLNSRELPRKMNLAGCSLHAATGAPRTAHLPELCLLIMSKRVGKGQCAGRRHQERTGWLKQGSGAGSRLQSPQGIQKR